MAGIYHMASFAALVFVAGIWSGKGLLNIAIKVAFLALAGFGAVVVAGDLA